MQEVHFDDQILRLKCRTIPQVNTQHLTGFV